MSSLGREETDRFMARVKREAKARERRSAQQQLDAWRLELEDRLWRARACVAAGASYDQRALEAEIAAFKAVAAGIEGAP